MVKKKALEKLIADLLNDLPKLKNDKSYYYNDPMYFNYAVYYDSLCEKISTLEDKGNSNLYGIYLVGFIAYQILDNNKQLFEVCEMLIEMLQEKLDELNSQTGETNITDSDDDIDDNHKCQA